MLVHDFYIVFEQELDMVFRFQAIYSEIKCGDVEISNMFFSVLLEKLFSIAEEHSQASLQVSDSLILDIKDYFANVDTIFDGVKQEKGINYYGFTLFQPQSINSCLRILRKLVGKYPNILPVLNLFTKAQSLNAYVLHSGI